MAVSWSVFALSRASLALTGVLAITCLAVSGCSLDGEPSSPCPAILSAAGVGIAAPLSTGATLAVTTGDDVAWVISYCELDACEGSSLRVDRIVLSEPALALMVAASGERVVARSSGLLRAYDLEALHAEVPQQQQRVIGSVLLASGVQELVGALRWGDVIMYRDDDGLAAIDAAPGASATPLRLGQSDLDLRVIAIGDRNVLARSTDDEGETVHLVRVRPSQHHDYLGSASAGLALPLIRGKAVAAHFVRGPSPTARGETNDLDPDRPTDTFAIVTLERDGGYETAVISMELGRVVDLFPGAVRVSRQDLHTTTGLAPTSSDGRWLAYATPQGSAALRDLDSQSSCLVRADVEREHVLVGFGVGPGQSAASSAPADSNSSTMPGPADGPFPGDQASRVEDRVYLQAAPDTSATRDLLLGSVDLQARRYEALGDPTDAQILRALPSRRATSDAPPWALGVRDGLYAVGGSASDGAVSRIPINPQDMLVLGMPDDGVWLMEAAPREDLPSTSHALTVVLRRVGWAEGTSAGSKVSGALDTSAPPVMHAVGVHAPFTLNIANGLRLCAAPGRSGGWSPSCATPDDPSRFLREGPPSSEVDPLDKPDPAQP